MSIFLKNISFHGILLDALFDPGNKDWENVHQLVSNGIRSGAVKPLDTTVFSHAEVEDAFRYMAQGKHMGKVLIKVNTMSLENIWFCLVRGFSTLCRKHLNGLRCVFQVLGTTKSLNVGVFLCLMHYNEKCDNISDIQPTGTIKSMCIKTMFELFCFRQISCFPLNTMESTYAASLNIFSTK